MGKTIKDLFIKPSAHEASLGGGNTKNVNEALTAFASASVQPSEPTKEPVAGVVNANGIYEWSGIPSKASTIYTVQAFISSLPTTMDMDTKRNTLEGILNAAQLDTAQLTIDAEERLASLKDYADDISISIQNEIDEAKEKIEKMLEEIESTKVKMTQAQERCEEQLKIIKTEEVKIKEILTHL